MWWVSTTNEPVDFTGRPETGHSVKKCPLSKMVSIYGRYRTPELMRARRPPARSDRASDKGFHFSDPCDEHRQFLPADHAEPNQSAVTAAQIVSMVFDATAQIKRSERIPDLGIIQIAGYFVLKVPHQVVLIALLVDSRGVKGNAPIIFPKNSLGYERSPNVGHSEGTMSRQIEEREYFGPPFCILTVKRAPSAFIEDDIFGSCKLHWKRQQQPVDRIHVRVVVGEPLLDRATIGATGARNGLN